MSASRESQIRYRVINHCLAGNRQADLLELSAACSEALDGKPVDTGTIESDLMAMRSDPDTGYFAPVVQDELTGKYRYSDPDFSIEKIPLNSDELEKLASAAGLLEKLTSRGLLVELGGIIQKLVDAARINHLDTSKNIWEFIEFEKAPSFTGSKFLEPVIEAISHKKVLKLFYKPYEEDKPYFTYVHPYLLKEYRYRWYLTGLNEQRKSLRTYALDRIWEVEFTNHKYIPAQFNARTYFKHSVGVIVPSGDPREIYLEVKKPQAQYMISQPLHESQLIHEETAEYIIFTFHVHPTWEFKSMIRALGSEARIVKPDDLRNEMISELKASLGNYGEPL